MDCFEMLSVIMWNFLYLFILQHVALRLYTTVYCFSACVIVYVDMY